MEVVEIPIEKISVKFRLRTPSESKIKEIAESIQKIELLNPITLDSKLNLIAGYHRLLAFKLLGRQKIPSILKESEDKTFNELMEIDENLKRNELNQIEVAEHIIKREELLSRLGLTYSAGDNNHTKQTNKVTILCSKSLVLIAPA
jgi:ParB family chromosome partitioning protein